jgi:hypothetical protein
MIDLRLAAVAAALMASVAVPALAQQGTANNSAAQQLPGTATQQAPVPDAVVHKVGAALRQTATIRQKYADRAEAANSPQQKQELTSQVETEMLKAISDQGLSLQQYNQVIQMAQADPSLKQRVLSAAQSGG